MAVFTDKFIRGLRPAEVRYEERDTGCPGLALRVGVRGDKNWSVIAAQGGKRRRIRLGCYPDVSLAMARRLAAERRAASTFHVPGMRFRDLWEIYAREVVPNRRSFEDVRSVWRKWGEPVLGNVRLEDLTLRHGAELIDQVTRHSTANRARKVIRYINPMLGFAAGRGLIPGNPWAGLRLPEGVARRDRVLSAAEWQSVWDWSATQPYPWGPFLRVLMLSAQRLSEVAAMTWVEFEDDLWTIPAERHKSKRRHEVPLSRALRALIEAQPRHDAFVFSTMRGRAIVPGTKFLKRCQAETETAGWRFHDQRRTGATLMAEGGINRFIIERVLGHADHTVTAIYDRATYREEKRQALEVLAAIVRA